MLVLARILAILSGTWCCVTIQGVSIPKCFDEDMAVEIFVGICLIVSTEIGRFQFESVSFEKDFSFHVKESHSD